MKEKLAKLNKAQFEIQVLKKEIQKIQSKLSVANQAEKDFFESVLKGFRTQLSILKNRK